MQRRVLLMTLVASTPAVNRLARAQSLVDKKVAIAGRCGAWAGKA